MLRKMYICWSEGSERYTFERIEGETVIGRRPDCDVVVNNSYVSRRHAQIVGKSGVYTLIDLDSKYGTFVNGSRITEQVLKDGDLIELGKERVRLQFATDAPAFPHDDTVRFERTLADIRPGGNETSTSLEKISWLLDLQQQWGTVFTPDTAFDHILLSALMVSGAERAFILTRNKESFEYATGMNAAGGRLNETEFHTSRSVVDHVAGTGVAVFMVETLSDSFAAQASVIASGVKAIACLPLQGIPNDAGPAVTLGILYLDSSKAMHALSGLDERILRKLAADAGSVLERIELIGSIEERKTFERELALAEETQRALLPKAIPNIPGWELAAFSRPTRYVGGDFYDFIQKLDGSLVAVLGDVSGKGVSAALLSSMLIGSLHAQIHSQQSIEAAANTCNDVMREKSPAERFVTFFIAELHVEKGGQYLSAGHTTSYVYRRRREIIEELPSNNMLVGAFDSSFKCSPLGFETGDVLLCYSDGLTDAENDRGEVFGEERVLTSMRAAAGSGARAVMDQLTQDLDQFTGGRGQPDDITIMAIGRVE